MPRTYFIEFTFDFWEILYTEGSGTILHTGEGSNESRSDAHQRLASLIASGSLPAGKVIG